MTCIVGIEYEGGVILGGDSAASDGWHVTVRTEPKVFVVGGQVAIGYTTSFRMGNLLQYRLVLPTHYAGISDHEYLSTSFMDSVRNTLSVGGFATRENEVESGGTFLLGYRGKLYEVNSDYQIGRHEHGYAAVGSGFFLALGSLHTTNALGVTVDHEKRLTLALEAAVAFTGSVRPPFTFAHLPAIAKDAAA